MNKNKVKIICTKTDVAILLIRLLIIQNEIEEFDKNLFNDMQNLEVLVLNLNKIQKIQNETFKNLNSLVEIWLDQNEITEIEKKSFIGLDNLKILFLHKNKIQIILNETFNNSKEFGCH